MLRFSFLTLATVALISTVLTWRPAPVNAGELPIGAQDGLPPVYSMTPNSSSDVYVQGKYNRSGIFVVPHYEPKHKPIFHGYFDNAKTTVKHGYFDTPKPVQSKADQSDTVQPARR